LGVKTWADITCATGVEILHWAEAQPWGREMAACYMSAYK
jgi:hypothetical protein